MSTIAITPDDISGILQRRARQLMQHLDMPSINPALVAMHLAGMHDLAIELGRLMDMASPADQPAAPATESAAAH